MVWRLHCKHDPAGGIIKWKARLGAGGHWQVYSNTYWTTFTPCGLMDDHPLHVYPGSIAWVAYVLQ